MRPPLTILLALALTTGGADLAQAASTPSPLGTNGHGVRLVQRGRPAHLVVLMSPKRYRAVAGKELVVVCAPVPQETLGGEVVRPRSRFRGVPRPPGGVVARLHPPRRRTPLVTRLSPHWDWCAMTARTVRHHGNSTAITAKGLGTVALTAAGAAFAAEREVAFRVIATEFTLDLVARLRRRPRGLSVRRIAHFMHAVMLTSPAEVPPAGRLGLYTDGHRHHYAAQIDPAGELLFYEQDGEVTRTNLLRYLQDDSLLWGARPFG